jgi:tetratricopeptide (TPR) repeat protein
MFVLRLIFLLSMTLAFTTTNAFAQVDEVVETADRLGLANISLRYYERQVNSGDSELAKTASEKLADLYARRLISIPHDASLRDDLIKRVTSLIQRFPQTNKTSLRVLLLQADVARGEDLIGDWYGDFQSTSKLTAAREIFASVGQQLDVHQKNARTELNELLGRVDVDSLPVTAPDRIRRDDLNQILGTSLYYSGWSNLYAASIGTNSDSGAVTRARDAFKLFLSIESEDSDYSDYVAMEPLDDEIQLQLFGEYQIRSVIGLALTEYVSGNEDSADYCFNWLNSKQVSAVFRDDANLRRVQCLLRMSRIAKLRTLVESVIEDDSTQGSDNNIVLFTTLIGYGHQMSDREVLNLGVSGLAKIERQDALAVMLNKYDIKLSFGESFFIDSVLVAQQLRGLDDDSTSEERRAVIDRFNQLVTHHDAARHRLVTARNNQSLAQLLYKEGEFLNAGEAFERAASGFSTRDKDAEAELLFNAFVCFYKVRNDDPSAINKSKTLLQRLKNEHLGHPLAAKAGTLLARLEKFSLDAASQITRLDQMSVEDSGYAASRYELCLLLHRRWQEIGSSRVAASDYANRLERETKKMMNVSGITSQQKARACLLVADVMLNSREKKPAIADQYLARADVLFDSLDEQSRSTLLPEYHFRRYQWARVASPADADEHASWLASNADGSPFQLPGLISLAREFEAASEGSNDQAEHQRGFELYLKIANIQNVFDDSTEIKGNVAIVLQKLGHYAGLTKQHNTALKCYRRLITSSPNNREFLFGGGRSAVATADFTFGLECWRPLAQGLPKGSDQWLEAKYYQIQCLRATDIAAARKVLSQFKAIYPEPGTSEFGKKLKSLTL